MDDLDFAQELIELEQMQKVETSLKINREACAVCINQCLSLLVHCNVQYLGILFTSWSHLAVSLQIERRKEETDHWMRVRACKR